MKSEDAIQASANLTGASVNTTGAHREAASLHSVRPLAECIALACHDKWQSLLLLAEEHVRAGTQEDIEAALMLIAEAAIRNKVPRDNQRAQTIWKLRKRVSGSLAWLPLHSNELERSVPLWDLNHNGGGSLGTVEHTAVIALNAESPFPEITEIAVLPPDALEAFRGMANASNGRSEAWSGTSASPLEPSQSLATYIAGALPRGEHRRANGQGYPHEIPACEAVARIVGAAVSEGTYTNGMGALHGRDAGWRTLKFLTSCPDESTFDEVAAAANASHWMWLPPASAWFDHVVCDGFIACIDPSRRKVSSVAWTDSD